VINTSSNTEIFWKYGVSLSGGRSLKMWASVLGNFTCPLTHRLWLIHCCCYYCGYLLLIIVNYVFKISAFSWLKPLVSEIKITILGTLFIFIIYYLSCYLFVLINVDYLIAVEILITHCSVCVYQWSSLCLLWHFRMLYVMAVVIQKMSIVS
jgi:hypothetical protein